MQKSERTSRSNARAGLYLPPGNKQKDAQDDGTEGISCKNNGTVMVQLPSRTHLDALFFNKMTWSEQGSRVAGDGLRGTGKSYAL